MRVLLIGKGGREHALAWKLAQSPLLTRLFFWPGNAAMQALGEPLDVPAEASHNELVAAARRAGIDVVVCGPEAPLAEGLADTCLAAKLPVFGPVQAAAQLETSKAFAKRMMAKAKIPTAAHALAGDEAGCRRLATAALARHGSVVLKASGLAAGKGVFVCHDEAQVEEGLRHLYHTDMRQAAAAVVVEDFLTGRECSYFVSLGARGPIGLGFAVDYKRVGDGDSGPNTGGMGCYAPVPWLPADAEAQVQRLVVEPLTQTLAASGIPYTGWLYVGLMWSRNKGPQVVEFNVRLGDPEAEVLALHDDRDWLAVIAAQSGLAVAEAQLAAASAPQGRQQPAVVAVMTSPGYPFGPETAAPAELSKALFAGPLPASGSLANQAVIFGAAVAPTANAGLLRTGTGRVLVVGARGQSFAAARAMVYAKVKDVAAEWPAARWRTDIAATIPSEVDL